MSDNPSVTEALKNMDLNSSVTDMDDDAISYFDIIPLEIVDNILVNCDAKSAMNVIKVSKMLRGSIFRIHEQMEGVVVKFICIHERKGKIRIFIKYRPAEKKTENIENVPANKESLFLECENFDELQIIRPIDLKINVLTRENLAYILNRIPLHWFDTVEKLTFEDYHVDLELFLPRFSNLNSLHIHNTCWPYAYNMNIILENFKTLGVILDSREMDYAERMTDAMLETIIQKSEIKPICSLWTSYIPIMDFEQFKTFMARCKFAERPKSRRCCDLKIRIVSDEAHLTMPWIMENTKDAKIDVNGYNQHCLLYNGVRFKFSIVSRS